MRRLLSYVVGGLPLLIVLAIAGGGTAACGKDSSSPASVCSRVSMSSDGAIDVAFNSCNSNSYSYTLSNIQFDQFGRTTSYNFSISCTGSSESYSGRVSSISYNNIGQVTAWAAIVNGENCSGS